MVELATPAAGYNERLFSRAGLRRFYHMARFAWVRDKVARTLPGDLRVIELGCFDGRLFDTLGSRVSEYVGVDANVEGGLDQAREKFDGRRDVALIEATHPDVFDRFPDRHFDIAASLETLEHVPPELVTGFLDQLQRVTRGHLFITVPNELGPVFLAKFLAKRLYYGGGEPYSFSEVVAATLRRSDKVERDEHKGFDYRDVIGEVAKRFEIVEVIGLPRMGLPPALSPTVAIFAKSFAAS